MCEDGTGLPVEVKLGCDNSFSNIGLVDKGFVLNKIETKVEVLFIEPPKEKQITKKSSEKQLKKSTLYSFSFVRTKIIW